MEPTEKTFKPDSPSAFKSGALGENVSLQGHYDAFKFFLEKEIGFLSEDLEQRFKKNEDLAAFVPQSHSAALVRGSFRDHQHKPITVMDVLISVNLADGKLRSPVFEADTRLTVAMRQLLMGEVARAVANANGETDSRASILNSFSMAGNLLSDQELDSLPPSVKAAHERLKEMELAPRERLPGEEAKHRHLQSLESYAKEFGFLSRGFERAVELLSHYLHRHGLSYQAAENQRQARIFKCQEYQESDPLKLPDENFSLVLRHYDPYQLQAEQDRYYLKLKQLENETHLLAETIEGYGKSWLARVTKPEYTQLIKASRAKRQAAGSKVDPEYLTQLKDLELPELQKVQSGEVGKSHPTFTAERDLIKTRLLQAEQKLKLVKAGKIKELLEGRLTLLKNEMAKFEFQDNPYQLEKGLHLEIKITTAKKKRPTFEALSRMLSELLPALTEPGQIFTLPTEPIIRSGEVQSPLATKSVLPSPQKPSASSAVPKQSTEASTHPKISLDEL